MAAPTQTTSETKAEGKAGFPPFEPQYFPSQLLWLAITFGAIYLFVSKVVIPRVGGAIAERAQRISRDLDEAAAAKQRADDATEAYSKALAEARGRAEGIARQTRAQMNAVSEAKRKAIEAELVAKLAGADKEIATRKKAAMGNVGAVAQEAASDVVAKLTGRAADAKELAAALANVKG
jgi:F-type H+-transporting ATPase subunit b